MLGKYFLNKHVVFVFIQTVSLVACLFQDYLTTDLATRADYVPKSQAGLWIITQGEYGKNVENGFSTWKERAGQELLSEISFTKAWPFLLLEMTEVLWLL